MCATALLLNWKRQKNLKRIIKSIKKQSVDVEIFLWNNNPEDLTDYGVDLQINSSKNLMCYPRWFLINYAKNPYIFTLDDDLIFSDEYVIKDCLEYLENGDCVLGYRGVILKSNKKYQKGDHISPDNKNDVFVDILKGRFIIGNKKHFLNVPLVDEVYSDISNSKKEDDIYVSKHINSDKIVPSMLKDRFVELGSLGVGLCESKSHINNRDNYVNKYFK